MSTIFSLATAFAIALMLRGTVCGRWVYATGANAAAARLMGVPVGLVSSARDRRLGGAGKDTYKGADFMSAVDLIVDSRNILGEVPLWDVQEQALYWVDIEGKLLQRYRPDARTFERWEMPERIGSFALRERGGLIVALASGIALYDLDSRSIEWIAGPDPNPGNRFNEGKCDRKGRFWAGTMDDGLRDHSAALFRVDADLSVHKIFDRVGISNCFIWSLDNNWFYFADSLDKHIYRFAYDHESGQLSDRRLFVDTNAENIVPDGGTIDEEGFIWNAQWDGWRVVRYAPDGRVDHVVELPIGKPTSCMFGGPHLRTMFVTSAIWDLTPDQLRHQPAAGGLFAFDAGVCGVPEPRFAG